MRLRQTYQRKVIFTSQKPWKTHLPGPRHLFLTPWKTPISRPQIHSIFPKNHYILWFYPSLLSKTTIWHLNYRSLMWCCGGIDACIYIILLIHWNTIYPLTIHSPERLFPLLTIYPFSCNSAIIRFTVRNETPNSFCNSFCATLSSGDVTLIPIMVPELVPMVPA